MQRSEPRPGPRTHDGRWHRLVLTLTVAAVLGGCGGAGTPVVGPAGEDGAAADGAGTGTGADDAARDTAVPADLPVCQGGPSAYDPPAAAQPATDPAVTSPELFPDIAVTDGGGDQDAMSAFGAARAWAETEATDHFAGLWVDGDHNAAVIAFTDDVDRYATEVRDRFGGGWWVVRGEHSFAELMQLQEALTDEMGGTADGSPSGTVVGSGISETSQQVSIDVVGGDEAALADLAARFDHPAYCFSVLPPPPIYEASGPVRTLATVAGWRDGLVDEHPGYALLEIAYDRTTAERAFAENVPDDLPTGDGDPSGDGLHAGLDTVAWDREVVAVWSGGRSGSCPVWIDAVRVDDGSVAVIEGSQHAGICTDDYNAFRTVLAIDAGLVPPQDQLPMPVNGNEPQGSQAVAYP